MNGMQGSTCNFQRGAALLSPACTNACSHLIQRGNNAAHRATAQRFISHHAATERKRAEHTRQQTHSRTRVPAINICCRGNGTHACAGNGKVSTVCGGTHNRSQLLHGAQGVQTICAAQIVAHAGRATRQSTQYRHAVGYAFIAGHSNLAAQRMCGQAGTDDITRHKS